MATTALSTSFPTLLDHMTRMDPNGAVASIVETLAKQNNVITDAVFQEGNLATGHRFTSRTALPSIGRRRFNEGVAPAKSKTAQITESTTMLEAFSAVDVDEADLNGNAMAFRASEDAAFLEAMNQKAESEILYGSSLTDPSDMTGIIPRFDSTSADGYGNQIVLHTDTASGSDQTSMLLVGWGPQSVFGIFPKGSKGGITPRDLGRQMWDPNNDGSKFLAWVMNWNWKLGLCVKDYRQVAAIRNIDTGSLSATGNTLIQSAIKAYHKLWRPSAVKPVWYCNRTVAEYLHLQALDSVKNATLRIEDVAGQPVIKLLGFPVRVSDSITSTEAAIS